MSDIPSSLQSALAGRYRIDREIGSGGMATVYAAEDLRHRREVAIKILRPHLAASLGAERFLREIGIAARLSHPHIVPLIDSGEEDGELYYVSQYVPGGSLRERLRKEGPLPIPEALRIAEEIGAALDYAHRSDIVHRDVKPENILFVDGHAVLTDFGIARACCEAGATSSEMLTLEGVTIGTPDYMSPEQASGEVNLSTSSDVYSLACVVYEMLTGEPPFKSDSVRTTIARQIAEAPPLARIRRPDVPPGVDRALQRAMAKEPTRRFARVTDFIAALREEGAPGAPASSARTRSIAVLPFVNASPDADNEYLSDGITDELIDALSKVRGLRVAARSAVFALKGKVHDPRAVGAMLGASVVVEGTVRKAGNRLRISAQLCATDDGRLLWSQRFDRTLEDVFELQDEIAHTIVDALRATLLADLSEPLPQRYTANVAAYGLYLKGRFEWNKRTQEGVAEGIRYFEQAIAEDPLYAPAYTGLADSYALQVDYRSVPVREGFERAKAYARRALEIDETLAEAHASLAWSLFIYDWDFAAAGRSFRRAIELAPGYASAHQWYGFLLAAQARHDEALIEGHTAQELDPASVSIRRGLGWLYLYARRYDQARYHLERAVAMNPVAEESYRVLGQSLYQLGQVAEAERVLREALGLPTASAYARATLGYVLAQSGRTAEAEALLEELHHRAAQDYVSPVAFATIHLGLGQFDAALDHAERSLEERRGWMVYAKVNALFDPIREHPRFQALAARVGL